MTRKFRTSADLGRRPIGTLKATLCASVVAAAALQALSAVTASSAGASGASARCSGDDLYVCATSVPRGTDPRATVRSCSGNDLYVCATSEPRWTDWEVA